MRSTPKKRNSKDEGDTTMSEEQRFCDCGTPVDSGSYTVYYLCESCPKMELAFYESEPMADFSSICHVRMEEDEAALAAVGAKDKSWR